MLFGYARVSTKDQKFNLQTDALSTAGVKSVNIFKDVSSGAKTERKEFNTLLEKLRKGDTLVVWKLDRVARSVAHLARLIDDFNSKEINFKSISEQFIDTSSTHGKFIFNIFSAVAQLERDLISERTKAGLESARKRGRIGGKPKGLSTAAEKKAKICESLYKEGKTSVKEILEVVGVSRMTFYKYLRYRGVEIGKDYTKKEKSLKDLLD